MDPKVSDSWYDRNKGREKKVLQEASQDNQHPAYHITARLRQSCAILNGLPRTRLPTDITFILYDYQWTMWFPLQSTYLDLYLFCKKRQYLCKQNHHQIPSSASNVMTISQGWFLTLNFPFPAYSAKYIFSFLQRQSFYSSRFPVTQGSTDTVWRPDASSFYVSRAPLLWIPMLTTPLSPACYFWCTWNNWQRIYVETITAIN